MTAAVGFADDTCAVRSGTEAELAGRGLDGTLERRWRWVLLGLAIVTFLAYDAASVSHAGGDTLWAVHQSYSVVTEFDLDLDEYRDVWNQIDFFTRERDGRILYDFPWGSSIAYAPIVGVMAVAEEVRGDGFDALLETPPPLLEVESNVQAVMAAAVVVLMAVWLRRRLDPTATLALTFVFAFATSMMSSVSRAMWNAGPALLGVMIVLLALDEFLRESTPRRQLIATAACAVVPVWIYITRPSAAFVGLVVILVIGRKQPRHLVPLAVIGFASLAVTELITRSHWGEQGQPYYERRLNEPEFKFEAFFANLVSPGRGLLIWSPVFVIAIVAVRWARRHPSPLIADLTIPAVVWIGGHLVLISTMERLWWAGFSTGPRLMADALPAWMLLLAAAVEPIRSAAAERRAVLWGVALMTAWSLATNVHAATDFDVHLWNNDDPVEKMWDWSDPPFLR